jgi:hypothetical protein
MHPERPKSRVQSNEQDGIIAFSQSSLESLQRFFHPAQTHVHQRLRRIGHAPASVLRTQFGQDRLRFAAPFRSGEQVPQGRFVPGIMRLVGKSGPKDTLSVRNRSVPSPCAVRFL